MDRFDHLAIDDSDLIEALQARLDEGFWVLDLETGEVVLYGDPFTREGEVADVDYDDSEHFMVIEPIPSHEAFRIMEAFVESLPESEGQRSLDRALRHSRPFRSFKDTLCDFLPLREAWFKFQKDRMLEIAQDWLEDNVPGARITHR